MKTDKDIRKFLQDNKIQVPEDDAFIADLVRQIDLLPVPASLRGTDEERIQENMRILSLIREMLRKRCRRQALMALLLNAALSIIMFAALYFLVNPQMPYSSPVIQFVITWRYMFLGVLSLGILAFSLSRTGLFNV
ncbi:MAG: hypothetical protein IKA34_08160 [Bacteroidales bacterium]|nr:hypothetical protein [Bacteroidales bacterium]MBR1960521.1 hypothetical protein [Bacteroidales bacterium]